MRRRFLVLVSLSLAAVHAASVQAQPINGYAVANHRNCGASNLPGTILELDKFFASAHFPADAQKNFQWNDAAVKAADWAKASDSFPNSNTATGMDGADSALISYIASHGVTSSGKYTALTGGQSNLCYIRTPEMSIGDQAARYLILSTCQGLKIGTGDDPTRAGENPTVTWANANQGLNCIFGYSNNMVDADDYGDYLLEALATSDDTLTEAFFRSARRVSYSNIPAALCFGANDAAATRNLETARRFTEDRYGKGGSAWAYDNGRRLDRAFVMPENLNGAVVPRVMKAKPRTLSVQKLAGKLVAEGVREAGLGGGLKVYRQGASTMTFDPRTNVVAWRKGETSLGRATTIKDQTAIRIATDFVKGKGIVADPATELLPTYVIERGARVDGQATTVAKTVVFHQRLRGTLTPLNAAGTVEVTVDHAGQVQALTASLFDVAQLRVSEWMDLQAMSVAPHKDFALRRIRAQLPGANVAVLETRIGYDLGDYASPHDRVRLTVEVTMEAEQGGFARRYIEKVPL